MSFPATRPRSSAAAALQALEGKDGELAGPSIDRLMDALDSYIPEPVRALDLPFLMPVEDVFSITGRGTVATGRVERGICKVGENVEIVGLGDTKKTVVTGVEMFRKLLDQGQAGDNIGVLLRGIDKEGIERGQVICKPGSITPHTHFKANVYVLSQGRRRAAHAVLQGLPAAVLLPDHRRDGRSDSARRRGDGDAGRQHRAGRQADQPDRHGRGLALSPSAKAAAPSAPASSARSFSNFIEKAGRQG